MSCGEAVELISALLDGELGVSDTVRLERKVVALRAPFVEESEDLLDVGDDGAMGVDGKGESFEGGKAAALCRRLAIALTASH